MKVKEIIKKTIRKYLEVDFAVEHPSDEKMGDYACNAALVAAKSLGKNPREVATELSEKLKEDTQLMEVIEKIDVAGPGFLNFAVRNDFLTRRASEMVREGGRCLDADFMSGKKVLVEYSSPNIAKRFSVGHLRSTIIGHALFKIYEHCGAEVTNDNHLGDWGTQFGMIIAAVERNGLDVSKMSVPELETLYVSFNKELVEKPELKELAREAFARLENGEEKARAIWKDCVAVSMMEFDRIYDVLGVKFDHEYGESAYESAMPGIIKEAIRVGVASEGERGALIVKFEKDGKEYMPPAMLRKADGTTTYFTRDLATIRKRLDDKELKSDMYIYEVGSEQSLHFKQVFEAARLLWEDAASVEWIHVPHGLMTFGGEKMSTRKGTTIKLEDLLDKAGEEAGLRAKEKIGRNKEVIGIGAVKYNELKRSHESNYDFKWDEALAMEGNSGPYLQYVYVRTRGVLENAKNFENNKAIGEVKLNEDERSLLAWLVLRFGEGEVLESAAKNFGPHLVCQHLFELAQRFNGFYDRNRVIGVDEEKLRLMCVALTGQVIKAGLNILGIETVDKM